MRRGGLGLLLVLAVALIAAYLMMGHMRAPAPAGELGTPESDPVQQAQSAVDQLNQHTQEAGGQ